MHPLEKAALFIFLLATLIFVHELGHFLMAKLFRVKVLKFSLGFGPRLLGFRWGETEYCVSALPLGGYVKMAGEDPTEELPEEDKGRGFFEQAPWKRGLIAFAGPGMSLLFPVLVYFLAYNFQGEAYSSLVSTVEPDGPAFAAGLRPGDRITSVDGEPVRYFEDLVETISPKWERKVRIGFERGGKAHEVELVPARREEKTLLGTEVRGLIGIRPLAQAPIIGVADPESPAAKAGLRTFDRIVKVGGKKTASYPQLASRLAALEGPVELTVVRDRPEGGAAGALTTYETFTTTLAPELRGGEPWLGIEPSGLYVFSVERGSPAWEAGLRRGDKLLEANGKVLHGWSTFDQIRYQAAKDKQPLKLAFLQNGQRIEREVMQKETFEKDQFDNKHPVLLFGATEDRRASSLVEVEKIPVQIPPGKALAKAAKVVPQEIGKTVVGLWMLASGQLSSKNIGGPIMIYKVTVQSAEAGKDVFLRTMGFISINLGLLNLLPIPVLDGFHILSAGFETIRRRPLGLKARIIANYIGLAMLLMLMLLAFKNDIVNFLLN
ncbi:MAG: RIP metalloprotease RseP [Myxococcales bacterium]|jgi:regulator of sigma E protease